MKKGLISCLCLFLCLYVYIFDDGNISSLGGVGGESSLEEMETRNES